MRGKQFCFQSMLATRSVEAPRLWQKMATQRLANVEEEWMHQKRCSFFFGETGKTHGDTIQDMGAKAEQQSPWQRD